MKKKKKKSLPLRNKIRQHPRLRNLVQIRQVIVVCPMSEEGIVKDMMFSVIIVTGLDTLQSIVGRNSKRSNAEASGKSTGNTPKALATTAELSDEQLEEELAKRRLGKEREMLDTTGSVQVVTGKAISPTMVVDVEIEVVLVSAVVDTGSQSTIVSRPFLHKVKRHF